MRWLLAIVGGLGFGWYVDELGKYVSNAGYLFRPALALIYVTFIVMFLAFRTLASRDFGPDDAVANALESLQVGRRSGRSTTRNGARRCAASMRSHPKATSRTQVARPARATPRRRRRARRVGGAGSRRASRARYVAWSHRASFTIVIEVFFFLLAVSTLGGVVGAQRRRTGITKPSEKVATSRPSSPASSCSSGSCGCAKSRLAAFRWFDRGLLDLDPGRAGVHVPAGAVRGRARPRSRPLHLGRWCGRRSRSRSSGAAREEAPPMAPAPAQPLTT